MSPQLNQDSSQETTTSPWTESFQTNPIHVTGSYSVEYTHDSDAQAPTTEALTNIYDVTYRD